MIPPPFPHVCIIIQGTWSRSHVPKQPPVITTTTSLKIPHCLIIIPNTITPELPQEERSLAYDAQLISEHIKFHVCL